MWQWHEALGNCSLSFDVSVLLRCLGDNSVMDTPVRRLVEVSQLPSVTLRTFRWAAITPVTLDSFVSPVWPGARGYATDVVSTEQLTGELHLEGETGTYQYRLAFEFP
jgi:hypothetical protein